MIKTCIQAKSNISNLNLTRYKQLVSEATIEANNAARYIFDVSREYYSSATAEYLKNCGESCFEGFPLYRAENGEIVVILRCGAKAKILADDAIGYEFSLGLPQSFKYKGFEKNRVIVTPCEKI